MVRGYGTDAVDDRKWDQARSICMGKARALNRGDEFARDLSQGFVYRMMCLKRVQSVRWPYSDETTAWIVACALRHIHTEMERDRVDKKHYVPRAKTLNDDVTDQDATADLPD